MESKYKLGSVSLSSSVDPSSLAKTVEGAIIAGAGIIALIISYFNLPIAVEAITSQAANIGITVGTLVSLYGLIRKVVVHFTAK